MKLTDTLRQEYIQLFESLQVRPYFQVEVDMFIRRAMRGQDKYAEIETNTGVPWYIVAMIHGLECSFNFDQHLHNGDSLQRRTHNEPAGRPVKGNPPFDWAFSAYDALAYDNFTDWDDWSLAGICYKLEGYNGWGYRTKGIYSPYLWSFSNHYDKGKFSSDGHYDANLKSNQCGAITALWQLVEYKLVTLKAQDV